MENIERITTLEVQMQATKEWVKEHETFHKDLLEKQDKMTSKKQAKYWALLILGLTLLSKELIQLFKGML